MTSSRSCWAVLFKWESLHTHTHSCVQLLAAARRASPVHFSITNIIGDKTKQKRKNTEEKENKKEKPYSYTVGRRWPLVSKIFLICGSIKFLYYRGARSISSSNNSTDERTDGRTKTKRNNRGRLATQRWLRVPIASDVVKKSDFCIYSTASGKIS